MISDYAYSCLGISFNKVIVSILSSYNEMEDVPELVEKSDLIIFVSEEAWFSHNKAIRNKRTPIWIFPNYATSEFFISRAHATDVSKIAVISNHVPEEVKEMKTSTEFTIDLYGSETKSVEVTPDLLRQYDVVISIGRTAQMCFASLTPFYCYDWFGGPGYINSENFYECCESNFSGRSHPVKRGFNVLLDEVCAGYSDAISNLLFLRNKAEECFNFDHLFSELIERIDGCNVRLHHKKDLISHESLPCVYSKQKTLCTLLKEKIMLDVGRGQLFYTNNMDEAFSESKSICFNYSYNSLTAISLREFDFWKNVLTIRFDPDDHPCVVELRYEEVSGCTKQSEDHFFLDDPQYLLPNNIESLSFIANPLTNEDIARKLHADLRRVERLVEEQREVIDKYERKKDSLREKIRSLTGSIKESICT